jgi:hypothetical protein
LPKSLVPLLGLARSSEVVPDAASEHMGSSLPRRPWLKQPARGFHCDGSSENVGFPNDPLVTFRSPPECWSLGRRREESKSSAARLPPLRFLPLRRFPGGGQPLTQGFHPLVPVPPQRFSRSRGFHPPVVCRPCFVPVPPLGFPFRVDFHLQSGTSSRTPLPSYGWSEDLRFRVLFPASVLLLPNGKPFAAAQQPSWASPS